MPLRGTCRRVAQQASESARHLLRGSVRKGDGHYRLRIDIELLDQERDPVRKDPRLSRPRPGDNYHGFGQGLHRPLLVRIESSDICDFGSVTSSLDCTGGWVEVAAA